MSGISSYVAPRIQIRVRHQKQHAVARLTHLTLLAVCVCVTGLLGGGTCQ